MHLTIGNKCYSSWSLRPWLLLRAFDIPFAETVIPLGTDDFYAEVSRLGAARKVPILEDGDTTVWDSLAIVEYLAETFPDKAVWPRSAAARALARCISAEMHSGFPALRRACPMNLGKRFVAKDRGAEVAADVERIVAIWSEARERFGASAGGPFLFGAFSAADAMYAPVVTRLETYSIDVPAGAREYMTAVLDHPAFRHWREAALAETWIVAHDEVDEPTVEVYRNL